MKSQSAGSTPYFGRVCLIKRALIGGFLLGILSTQVVGAPAPANDAFNAAFQSADASGMVRVIITLKEADKEIAQLPAFATSNSADRLSALEGARQRGSSLSRQQSIARHQAKALQKLRPGEFRVSRQFRRLPFVALKVNRDALDKLLTDPAVSVSLERKFKPLLASSVPLILGDKNFSGSTPYNPVLAENDNRGKDQTIAILDTGVEKANAFIGASRVVSEACYSTPGGLLGISTTCPGNLLESTAVDSGEPCDVVNYHECNHGTLVAGVVAGNGNTYDGVATGADLMSVKVFSYDLSAPDTLIAYEGDVLLGLERVLEVAQDTNSLINISSVLLAIGFSDPSCSNASTSAFKLAIDNLKAAGIATIAASGNAASDTDIDFPACISSAISVGASTDADARWAEDQVTGSNEGVGLNLYAPGVDITSSDVGGADLVSTGTSFSAAHVAGAWAVLKQAYPAASVDEILAKLTATAVSVTGNAPSGAQRIQLDTALDPVGLTVKVVIDSTFGGSATVDDFDVSVDAVEVEWPNLNSTTGDRKLVSDAVPATFALSEIQVDGYSNGVWSCAEKDGTPVPVVGGGFDNTSVSVAASKAVTCEITNAYQETASFFTIPVPGGKSVIFSL